jgi:tartrate-resistant acid phosphatase type 5
MGRMIYSHVRSSLLASRKPHTSWALVVGLLAAVVLLLGQSTAPAQGNGSLSFLVISDLGGKGGSNQVAVATQMGLTAAAQKSSFVVTCGDNYHGFGIASADSPRWRTEFEDVYKAPSLMIPWYATLGNHEYRGKPEAEVAYSKLSTRWKMPARHYTHTEKIDTTNEALFVHLDTAPFVASYHKKGSSYHVEGQDVNAQLRWLESVLAASHARWKIVVGHHPIYAAAGGHGDTKELNTEVQPVLKKYGVRIYFCGHDHVLQHLVHGEMNFFVCGGGSTHRTVKERPDVRFGASSLGFLSMTLTPTEAQAAYLDAKGKELYRTTIPAR